MTRALVLTGGPGTGKSSVAQALTTLLENAGIEHGAIETEQLAWGTPWLTDAQAHEQLACSTPTAATRTTWPRSCTRRTSTALGREWVMPS